MAVTLVFEQLGWIHRSEGAARCSAGEEEAELSKDRLSSRAAGSTVLAGEEEAESEDWQPVAAAVRAREQAELIPNRSTCASGHSNRGN